MWGITLCCKPSSCCLARINLTIRAWTAPSWLSLADLKVTAACSQSSWWTSHFWMLNQTQRHLKPSSINSSLNHYCVARDSTLCCSGRAVFPWKIRHSADNNHNFKNQVCRAEAHLPQNTPGQSTLLTQQLCFPPLKWRSWISLFPGFLLLLPLLQLSNKFRAFLHAEIPRYLPNAILRGGINYLPCHRAHSDTEPGAENLLTPDPPNMVPGPYPRVRAAPGNFCLLSVQLQEQPESAITKALAQNMGSPRVV